MNYAIPRIVEESLRILRVQESMAGRPQYGSRPDETVRRVVEQFKALGVSWTLVGGHAVGMMTQPRATHDFDFVVEGARVAEVIERLRGSLGELSQVDLGPAVRLEAVSIDLIRSTTHPLFFEALERSNDVEGWRLPSPESLLSLKFLAAVSPWREPQRRMQDAADLAAVYVAKRSGLDRALLASLASRVYPGAERELAALLERIDRGDSISI